MLTQIGLCPVHSAVRVFGKIGYILKHECGFTFVDMPCTCLQIPNEYLVERVIRKTHICRKL